MESNHVAKTPSFKSAKQCVSFMTSVVRTSFADKRNNHFCSTFCQDVLLVLKSVGIVIIHEYLTNAHFSAKRFHPATYSAVFCEAILLNTELKTSLTIGAIIKMS